MDNKQKADARKQLQLSALNLLAGEEDIEEVDVRELCDALTALFVRRVQGTKRLDPILQALRNNKHQHPRLKELAEKINEAFRDFRIELLDQLVTDLRHPERGRVRLPLTDEVVHQVEEHRQRTAGEEKAS